MDPMQTIKRNVADTMRSQVEDFILTRIDNGEWRLGEKIPSERELSIRLDVSRTTVRNAVQALTERGLFERHIGQGTFVRSRLVESPVQETKPHTGTIGYVVCKDRFARKPISAESFYFDVFAGIEEETVRSGRHMLFTYLDDDNVEERASFREFLDKVDGIVLEEAHRTEALDIVAASGVPAALLGPTVVDDRFDLVTMNLDAGVRKALRYLRSLGHQRIGIVNGPLGLESASLRFSAWKDEMRIAGSEPDAAWADEGADWSAEAGYDAMDRLIGRCPGLTAVFCANDLLAVGALSALSKRGVRVPEDLSVVGFDNTELARHTAPPLTTMKIYSRDMARQAVKRVLERIGNPGAPPVRSEFPIDLVVRASCKEVKE